jgi:hypothetical protein
MLLGSGGKPDIRDLNGLEVVRLRSGQKVPSLRAENGWRVFLANDKRLISELTEPLHKRLPLSPRSTFAYNRPLPYYIDTPVSFNSWMFGGLISK